MTNPSQGRGKRRIISDDLLTLEENKDVDASWKEIKEGKAKKYRNIDEAITELREGS